MRVFVTGATGFVGSAVVGELLGAGHSVLGLARSDKSAEALAATGATVHRGSLDDLESLRSGAAATDGVIHTAFIHDFSNMAAAGAADKRAIETIGEALAGSGRPFVTTTGLAFVAPGRLATEDDRPDAQTSIATHRLASEVLTLELASRDVRTSLLRLPPSVHGAGDHGFVPFLIQIAREKGVSAYIGDGSNRWPAVHRFDAAVLYRLALEQAAAGSVLHGVGEEGVPTRDIATAIGKGLNLPVVSVAPDKAAEHFGWMGTFFAIDCPASSVQTQETLGWRPVNPSLIADLEQGHYFAL